MVKDCTFGSTVLNGWGCLVGGLAASVMCSAVLPLIEISTDHKQLVEIALVFFISLLIQYIDFHPMGKKLALSLIPMNLLSAESTNPQHFIVWHFYMCVVLGVGCALIGNILPWPRSACGEVEARALFAAQHTAHLFSTIVRKWQLCSFRNQHDKKRIGKNSFACVNSYENASNNRYRLHGGSSVDRSRSTGSSSGDGNREKINERIPSSNNFSIKINSNINIDINNSEFLHSSLHVRCSRMWGMLRATIHSIAVLRLVARRAAVARLAQQRIGSGISVRKSWSSSSSGSSSSGSTWMASTRSSSTTSSFPSSSSSSISSAPSSHAAPLYVDQSRNSRQEVHDFLRETLAMSKQRTAEARFGPHRTRALMRYSRFNALLSNLLAIVSGMEACLSQMMMDRKDENLAKIYAAFHSRPNFRHALTQYCSCVSANIEMTAHWLSASDDHDFPVVLFTTRIWDPSSFAPFFLCSFSS